MNFIIPILLIALSVVGFFGIGTTDRIGTDGSVIEKDAQIIPYAIDPVYKQIKKLEKEKKSFLEKERNAEKITRKKRELQKIYSSLEGVGDDRVSSDLERVKKFLPDNIDNIKLITDIRRIKDEKIPKITNYHITEDRNDQKTKNGEVPLSNKKDYNSKVLSFSFVTDYDTIKNFINKLRKSLRLVDVVSITINPIAKNKNQDIMVNDNVFEVQMSIRTYWLNKK